MFLIPFILMFAGLIIRNYQLAQMLFYDWDEGMYAQIATEIIKNGSLFTTFNGQIWLDKPPFIHFLISVIFTIFGRSEFWARMIMTGASMILLILVYLLSQKILESLFPKTSQVSIHVASLLSVVTLAATPIFLERATLLNSDIFVAISWVGYFLYWDSYWGKLLFLTIGVWSKSILGFYPLCIELFHYGAQFTANHFKLKIQRITFSKIVKLLLFIFIPSLWYIAGILKYGQFFIENHFLSQVLKRLYVPIELHFGGKYFYINYLWDSLKFINIFFIIAYLLLLVDAVRVLGKNKLQIVKSSLWFPLLVLLTPIPYLILLTFMKTKITWYVIDFLPFLTLLIAYLFLRVQKRIMQLIIVCAVVIYFVYNFIPQTFLLKNAYTPPEKIVIARCLNKIQGRTIAFLVDENERKIQNFLEASHYDTTSSFYYGGSPSFVYYVQKKVDYYYNVDLFIQNLDSYRMVVLSRADMAGIKEVSQFNPQIRCSTENWVGIVK